MHSLPFSLPKLALLALLLGLAGCTAKKEEKAPVAVATPKVSPTAQKASTPKDAVAAHLARIFAQADGVHREAWWVISEERRPISKSPFGKVERAYLTAQNLKLPNKSLFRCDRYTMKRDVKGISGYPQTAEIFEKCSEKSEAKKLAYVVATNEETIQVTFYPDHLEDILGMGASILNRIIECNIQTKDGHLTVLDCKNWAQDRTKEQMVRLDEYRYEKAGKNLIKLRGKVFQNLTETRKIVADVPMEGKIQVVETELYAPPEEKPTPTPVSPKVVTKQGPNGETISVGQVPPQIPQPVSPPTGTGPMGAPESAQNAQKLPLGVDPDVIRQKEAFERGETDELPFVEGMVAAPPAAQALTPEQMQNLTPEQQQELLQQQQMQQEQQQQQVQDPHQAPPQEVIQTNENEGEYHAR